MMASRTPRRKSANSTGKTTRIKQLSLSSSNAEKRLSPRPRGVSSAKPAVTSSSLNSSDDTKSTMLSTSPSSAVTCNGHAPEPSVNVTSNPTVIPEIHVDPLELKPCLKNRSDVTSSERHVSVCLSHVDDNEEHVPPPRVPVGRQRGRSNSLPTEILQSHINQLASRNRPSCRLPALDEENRLRVEEQQTSSSNPDVSSYRAARRVSFVLPSDSDSSDSEQKPDTKHQNFLSLPQRSLLPGGSDAFQQAMLDSSDDSRSYEDSDSSDRSTEVFPVSPKEKHPKKISAHTSKLSGTHSPRPHQKRLLKRPDKRNTGLRTSRDLSPRLEWSRVTAIC